MPFRNRCDMVKRSFNFFRRRRYLCTLCPQKWSSSTTHNYHLETSHHRVILIVQRAVRHPQTSPPPSQKSVSRPLLGLPMARLHPRTAPPLHRTTRQAGRKIGRTSFRSTIAHSISIGLCVNIGIAAHEDWKEAGNDIAGQFRGDSICQI